MKCYILQWMHTWNLFEIHIFVDVIVAVERPLDVKGLLSNSVVPLIIASSNWEDQSEILKVLPINILSIVSWTM